MLISICDFQIEGPRQDLPNQTLVRRRSFLLAVLLNGAVNVTVPCLRYPALPFLCHESSGGTQACKSTAIVFAMAAMVSDPGFQTQSLTYAVPPQRD